MRRRYRKAKKHALFKKVAGIILALIGIVLIIHTVPMFVWYIILGILIFALIALLVTGR